MTPHLSVKIKSKKLLIIVLFSIYFEHSEEPVFSRVF